MDNGVEPNLRGLFVTGTDTGVGKTVTACGLARWARERGLRVAAIKPVETGCRVREGRLFPEDGAALREASGKTLSLEETAPFRFSLPASPYRASVMENVRLKTADLAEHVLSLSERGDFVIVEGAGGVLVPIEERRFMSDLMARLGFPVLLVGRTALGTINHTLLSLEVLKAKGLRAAAVILSSTSAHSGPEEEYTARDLSVLVHPVPLAVLPFIEAPRDFMRVADAMVREWPAGFLETLFS
jgi:dethiobiotin synthetase